MSNSTFSLSTLATYIDQQQIDLIKKPLLKNKSAELFQKVPGVKSAKALPLLNFTPNYMDGTQCGYTFSGSAAITQRTITVGAIKAPFNFCLKQLEPYFTSQMLNKGSHQETFSAEQEIIDQATAAVSKDLEKAVWQASTVASGSDSLLSRFDGFLRQIENVTGSAGYINATGSVAGGNLITGSITTTNVRQLIEQNVYGAIPVDIIDLPTTAVFVGRDVFKTYISALQLANNGAGVYAVYNKDGLGSVNIVGTDMPLIPLPGLNGTSKVVAGDKNNFFIGVDLESDSDTVRQWYSPDNDEVRMVYDFKYGTQIAWPDQTIYAFIH